MKTKAYPCVTAVVNTCERPHLLPRALESVLNQTYDDFEVMVVHDGHPSDETVAVMMEYEDKFAARGDVSLVLMHTGECTGAQGVPKSMGVFAAGGDYVAFLDDDNEWTPDHLKTMVGVLEESNGTLGMVYGRREYVRDENAGDDPLEIEGESLYTPLTNENMQLLQETPKNNFIDPSEVVMSRGAAWYLQARTANVFDGARMKYGDWDFAVRCLFFAHIPTEAVNFVSQKFHWTGENLKFKRLADGPPVVKTLLGGPGNA